MATISGVDGIAGNVAQLSAKTGVKKSDKDVSASDAFSSLLKLAGGGIDFKAGSGGQSRMNTDTNIQDIKAAPSRTPEPASRPADSRNNGAQQKPATGSADRKPLKTDAASENRTKPVRTKDSDKADKAYAGTEAVTGDGAIPADAAEDTVAVAEVIAGVFDILKEALSVDDAGLSGMLEETGVSIEELLTPEGLQNFILSAGGHTGVDMLVDENLAQTVNDAVEGLESLLEENGIADTESFTGKVEEFLKENSTDIFKADEKQERPELVLGREKNEVDDNSGAVARDTESSFADRPVSESANSQTSSGSETGGTFQNTGAGTEFTQQTATVREDFTGAMNNLNQAVAANPEAQGTVYVEGVGEVKQSDIISQVIDDIKANSKGGVDSLEVVLNPEQLGKVHINVISKNGVMQAQITAETEAAKNAIEQGIIALKENFEQQGLKVDEVEVMLANYEFFNEDRDAELEERRGGRRGNAGGGNDEDDTNEGSAATEDKAVMETKGSSVSYTA